MVDSTNTQTQQEQIALATKHQNILATINSLSAIETSMYNNLQNDVDSGGAVAEEIQKLYNKLYKMNIHTIKLNNIFGPGDMNFSRLIPFICKNFCDNKKFYLNSKSSKKSFKFTYVYDLINFIEDTITKNKTNNLSKKIKYHRSSIINIYKLLCKLNKKHFLNKNYSKLVRNNFENKLYSTLKWYKKNL